MDISNNLTARLDKAIASYLLTINPGEQLCSIRNMSEQFGASVGTVSNLLSYFEEMGAVKINRRGHVGSFLEEKSVSKLWSVIKEGPLVIGLTLPSFSTCEGLATAIYSLLNSNGIQTYMTFIRGSINRMTALRTGLCQAVVISELSADELCGPDEEAIIKLPRESFTLEHRVFYRGNQNDIKSPMRVGIDLDSMDIKYITEMEFSGSDVDFVNMTFTQIDLHLEDTPIDAAVTNSDFLPRLTSKGFKSRPLSNGARKIIGDRANSAVFVTKSDSSPIKIVLKEFLKPFDVLRIQKDVLEGRLLPRY